MAKRFTDTEKWKRDWFLSLTPTEKVFWSYLCDVCSPAGIWNVSWKSAEFHVGVKLDKAKIQATFAKQFIPIDEGKRWFIVDFIPFQYKALNPNNPAHKGAIEELQRYSLVASDFSIVLPINDLVVPSKELGSPSQGAKDKDTDKDMVKGTAKAKEKDVEFAKIWESYPNKVGRPDALRHFIATVKTPDDLSNIQIALTNYVNCGRVKSGFVQNGSTWFNQWQDWIKPSSVMMNGNSGGNALPSGPRPKKFNKCSIHGIEYEGQWCPKCYRKEENNGGL